MRSLVALLLVSGCASLYVPRGTAAQLTAREAQCVDLDDAYGRWSSVAAGAAYAAGTTGIGSLAIDDATGRVALAITTVVAGVVGAVATRRSADLARRLHADPACANGAP